MKNLLIFIIILASSCNTANNKKEGLLWKISGNGLSQPSYLFGTYHTINPSILDHVSGFNDVLGSVEQLVFEMNYSKEPYNQIEYQLPDGISYRGLLDKSDFIILDSVVHKYIGISLDEINLTPGYLDLALSSAYLQKESENWGEYNNFLSNPSQEELDEYILRLGQKKMYNIIGLETIEDRKKMGILKALGLENDDTIEKQTEKLINGIKILNSSLMKEYIKLELNFDLAYCEQDLIKLEKINIKKNNFLKKHATELNINKELEDVDKTNGIIFKSRNLFWMQKIPILLENKSTLISVGALHLVGEYGLINLLRKEGFKVESINN